MNKTFKSIDVRIFICCLVDNGNQATMDPGHDGWIAHVYAIDEPFTDLDVEQRISVAKMIMNVINNSNVSAFLVLPDITLATYLADEVIVFGGDATNWWKETKPQPAFNRINTFLKSMDMTMRRCLIHWRPRINEIGSIQGIKQKKCNSYFFWTHLTNLCWYKYGNACIYLSTDNLWLMSL